jgi:hypothetical protein
LPNFRSASDYPNDASKPADKEIGIRVKRRPLG